MIIVTECLINVKNNLGEKNKWRLEKITFITTSIQFNKKICSRKSCLITRDKDIQLLLFKARISTWYFLIF